MLNISLVMIVRNEAANLHACLESVKSNVNQIIIVDTGSVDETKEIANSFNANVYDFLWTNDFSVARNFALSKSTGDWNLILDADEQIVSWDKGEVSRILQSDKVIGKVSIKNKFTQNNEDRYSSECISRLLPKGVTFSGRIHEQVVSDLPRVELPIEVFHTGYYKTDKSKRNLAIFEAELASDPNNPYMLYQLGRQYKAINRYEEAVLRFSLSYQYIDRNENYFTDLVVNYIYTLIEMKNFYKAFEVIDRETENLRNSPDFHFVCGVFYMHFVLNDIKNNIEFLPLIEKSYLQCLELGEKGVKEIVHGTSTFLAAYNLGVYYEMFKQVEKARYFYNLSASLNYEPAKKRIITLSY
jgi:glycosyltransferase involved in cell wall biosynthesis